MQKTYVKRVIMIAVLYFIVLNLLPDIMQFKLISLLPREFRGQAKVVVILSTLVKSSLTVLFFGVLFVINRYVLRFAEIEISNRLILNAFGCLFLAAVLVECIRMGMAYFILIPFANNFVIHSVKDYHVLLTQKIPNSSWHYVQAGLDTSFILVGPVTYSSYLYAKADNHWLDVILSGLVICAGLTLVRYISL